MTLAFLGGICAYRLEQAKLRARVPVLHRRSCAQAIRVRKDKVNNASRDDSESRRPELRSLQGRFMPNDSETDEELTEVVDEENFDSFGDVREGLPRSGLELTVEKKWSKRAQAAKKRWANPEYRAKIMEKRRKKKETDQKVERKQRVDIGIMDSITLSPEEKAKAINAYLRANKLRSEKLEKHHRDKAKWMEDRLESGAEIRNRINNEEYKKWRKLDRSMRARQRMKKRKANEAARRLEDEKDDEQVSAEDGEEVS